MPDWATTVLTSSVVSSVIASILGLLVKRQLDKQLEIEKAEHDRKLASIRSEHAKDLETFRARVRLSELYFNRQLEACEELFQMLQDWLPERRHPDMTWSDALDEMGRNIENVEQKVTDLYTEYYAVLPEEVIDRLTTASALAREATFHIADPAPSGSQIGTVEQVYDELNGAAAAIKETLDGQSHALTSSPLEQQTRDRD